MRTIKSRLAALLLAGLACGTAQAAPSWLAWEVAHGVAKRIHGGVAQVADTGSMEPAVTSDDLLVYIPAREARAPRIGDIVIFKQPKYRDAALGQYASDGYVAHRVTGYAEGGALVTKGDANKNVDYSPVTVSSLIGVCVMVIHKDGVATQLKIPDPILVAL